MPTSNEKRPAQLEKDKQFCDSSRTIDDFLEWSEQRLLDVIIYHTVVHAGTREALQVALDRAKSKNSPAVVIAKEALKVAKSQRRIALLALCIAVLSALFPCRAPLLGTNIMSFGKLLAPQATPKQIPSGRPAANRTSPEGQPKASHGTVVKRLVLPVNPFVPSSAQDTKQVMDFSARIAVEQAHIQNDMMKLQAIKLSQGAQSAATNGATAASAAAASVATYQANILRAAQ